MKKVALIFIVCSLLLTSLAYSASVEIEVSEVLEGKLIAVSYDNTTNLINISTEFYNTGSIPYNARVETQILKDDEIVFSGWSQEKEFMPGDKHSFYNYWYADSPGDYSLKLKIYFGNEIKEYKKVDFIVSKIKDSEDIFEITKFRTYDDFVIFDIKSKENANNVVIIPSGYTTSWIFEQKVIEDLAANVSKTVLINYYPGPWMPSSLELSVISDKGKYYSADSLEMNKIEGLTGLYFYVTDMIRYAFFK